MKGLICFDEILKRKILLKSSASKALLYTISENILRTIVILHMITHRSILVDFFLQILSIQNNLELSDFQLPRIQYHQNSVYITCILRIVKSDDID
jgi:hypothetical protein